MTTLYPNSGALFTNDRKTHEKSPDFQGDVTVEVGLLKELMSQEENGFVKLRLSGWRKQSSRGGFVSLKVSAPFQKNQENKQAQQPNNNISDEDIPF